jgi:hypothetical protein
VASQEIRWRAQETRGQSRHPTSALATAAAAFARAAADRAQDTHRLRAKAEQNIIDSECRATRLALSQDKAAWRAYRRRRGMPAADFIPYLT